VFVEGEVIAYIVIKLCVYCKNSTGAIIGNVHEETIGLIHPHALPVLHHSVSGIRHKFAYSRNKIF